MESKAESFDVVTEQFSLSKIIDMINFDTIDIGTGFHRIGNLWSEKAMSRFIESILLRLPSPAFYFDVTINENKWFVIDGLQRLWALKRFVIDQDFILQDLEVLSQFNGLHFSELNHLRKHDMGCYQVTTYFIKPGIPKEIKHDIFRRINTGLGIGSIGYCCSV